MKVKEIVDFLLEKYPLDLASSFDFGKVGLQFGLYSKEVKKVMICLDGTTDVICEAIENNVDLLICHHPFLFSPILNLDYNSPLGKKMLKVFKSELNIFAMHTNFDSAINGMNDHLAGLLGLENVYSVPEVPTSESFMRIGEIEKTTLAPHPPLRNPCRRDGLFYLCAKESFRGRVVQSLHAHRNRATDRHGRI